MIITSPRKLGCTEIRFAHRSPDLAEDLTADALFAGGAVGHHASRRGDDGNTEAVADLRDVFGRHVRALARTRHAAHAGDRAARDRRAAVVAELDFDHALLVVFGGVDALHEAFVAEDLRDAKLHVRARALHGLLARVDPVANTRQEISDWIGHRHIRCSSPARLDDAGDIAAERELANAKTAHLELAQ